MPGRPATTRARPATPGPSPSNQGQAFTGGNFTARRWPVFRRRAFPPNSKVGAHKILGHQLVARMVQATSDEGCDRMELGFSLPHLAWRGGVAKLTPLRAAASWRLHRFAGWLRFQMRVCRTAGSMHHCSGTGHAVALARRRRLRATSVAVGLAKSAAAKYGAACRRQDQQHPGLAGADGEAYAGVLGDNELLQPFDIGDTTSSGRKASCPTRRPASSPAATARASGVARLSGRRRRCTAWILAIEDGEFLVLVGPSGCGKSTARSGRNVDQGSRTSPTPRWRRGGKQPLAAQLSPWSRLALYPRLSPLPRYRLWAAREGGIQKRRCARPR